MSPADPLLFIDYPLERYYYVERNLDSEAGVFADPELKALLVQRLNENPLTMEERIKVAVTRSAVILSGGVSTRIAKRAAGDDAWDTPGVADVSNRLKVPPIGESSHPSM